MEEKSGIFGEKMRDLRAKSGIFRVEIHDVGVTNGQNLGIFG